MFSEADNEPKWRFCVMGLVWSHGFIGINCLFHKRIFSDQLGIGFSLATSCDSQTFAKYNTLHFTVSSKTSSKARVIGAIQCTALCGSTIILILRIPNKTDLQWRKKEKIKRFQEKHIYNGDHDKHHFMKKDSEERERVGEEEEEEEERKRKKKKKKKKERKKEREKERKKLNA